MKKIEAIIRPMRLEAVKAALAEEAAVIGVTVSDVSGFSVEGEGLLGTYLSRGVWALAPKLKLEMIVTDEQAQQVIDTLLVYARTGAPGDGKIFVSSVADAVRIRTGDRGDIAVR